MVEDAPIAAYMVGNKQGKRVYPRVITQKSNAFCNRFEGSNPSVPASENKSLTNTINVLLLQGE